MDNCKDIAEVYEKHFKSEIEQLYACRAALRECLEQMERTPKSAVSPDFIAAIDDGRKALGEE